MRLFYGCHSAAQRRNLLFVFLLCTILPATLEAQWDIQDSHTTASLRGIHNVGGGVAWASGTNGTVLRTEDGGYLWQTCAVPPGAEKLDFRGIQAFDENTAIVMSSGKGDLSRLYKTTDGCRTWKLVFTNPDSDGFWDAISFIRSDRSGSNIYRGGVLGDPVNGAFAMFESVDSGETWNRKLVTKNRTAEINCKIDPFPAKKKEAMFAASNQSLLVLPVHFIFATGGSVARLGYPDHFDLDDAFCHDSARFLTLPMAHGNSSSGIFAIAVKNDDERFPPSLMAVGGDYQRPDDTHGNSVFVEGSEPRRWLGYFFRSVRPITPPRGYRSAVAYDAKTKTWITVGPNGTDISTDDGKNWRALRPKPGQPDDADKNWNALSLPFVVGPNGRIGKLRDDALKP
jgi:hypothetical protein